MQSISAAVHIPCAFRSSIGTAQLRPASSFCPVESMAMRDGSNMLADHHDPTCSAILLLPAFSLRRVATSSYPFALDSSDVFFASLVSYLCLYGILL